MKKTILGFAELASEDQPGAGGKGGTLARLYQAGFPVPDGCVLLPGAFDGDELTPEAADVMRAQLTRLRGRDAGMAYAVRSSALVEDSARASFAGEFETVLDASADAEVFAAIRVVRRRHVAQVPE